MSFEKKLVRKGKPTAALYMYKLQTQLTDCQSYITVYLPAVTSQKNMCYYLQYIVGVLYINIYSTAHYRQQMIDSVLWFVWVYSSRSLVTCPLFRPITEACHNTWLNTSCSLHKQHSNSWCQLQCRCAARCINKLRNKLKIK